MIREDKGRIVQGQVFYQNQWMPIERKVELEARNKKKIEEGYVLFQGEWITIDEKLARVTPQEPVKQGPEKVVYNQTVNRQTYNVHHNQNIDNRVIHEHDHRHVHVDGQSLSNHVPDGLRRVGQRDDPSLQYDNEKNTLEHKRQQQKMIPHDEQYRRSIEDKQRKEDSNTYDDSHP